MVLQKVLPLRSICTPRADVSNVEVDVRRRGGS
jgi:hypothetical protein